MTQQAVYCTVLVHCYTNAGHIFVQELPEQQKDVHNLCTWLKHTSANTALFDPHLEHTASHRWSH